MKYICHQEGLYSVQIKGVSLHYLDKEQEYLCILCPKMNVVSERV